MGDYFEKALPVCFQGLENEMHIRAVFRTIIHVMDKTNTTIKIATSGMYNLFVNGDFVAYGPARAGQNHFRVDEIPLTEYLEQGENLIAVEVAGYNVNSYCMIKQPSFLQAEAVCSGNVVAATGWKGFDATINANVIRKVQRFSFQRPMVESYRLSPGYDALYRDARHVFTPMLQVITGEKTIIPRLAPYPRYEFIPARSLHGGHIYRGNQEKPYQDRSYSRISKTILGFRPDELELHVTDEIQSYSYITDDQMDSAGNLDNNRFCMYSLPYNASGMIEAEVFCEEDTELYLVFDEVLYHGDISIPRSGCANTVKYTLEKGFYRLHLFEVYTMQYIKICNIGGKVRVSDLRLIEYKHPPVSCSLPAVHGDSALEKIAAAAIETFRQNAVDIFMDCPSRERAGWLCDSFFTGRVERLLTQDSPIEKSFLENFLHAGRYPDIPEGMVPMCYPADHFDGNFIVNWGQWLVLELSEYLDRSGDRDLIDLYRPKVYALLDYLKRQENSDGLMENLKGWVFVEWSKANELTQDVNYPSNMLYSLTLKAAGKLYGDDGLLKKSEAVKQEVLRQSYNGEFFTDNAVRRDGKLVPTNEITEVCQYYAFFCDIATPSTHPRLWNTLLADFGPDRKTNNQYPHIHFANAFIGNYLRLDVMMRYGYKKEVLDNIRGYFLYMAERTGTLWENDSDHASCNHGFASHVLYWLASM